MRKTALLAAFFYFCINVGDLHAFQTQKEASSPIDSETLPSPEPLTGYFTVHNEDDAAAAARTAESAAYSQAGAAAAAAEHSARGHADEAQKAALTAESVVAVQQERAAHLSNAAQSSQAQAYTSSALATKLSKALFAIRSLESLIIDNAKASRNIADSAEHIASLAIKATNIINRIEADQQQAANDAQAAAKKLAYQQSSALDALSNAQVAANHAHSAADAAKAFQVSKPVQVSPTTSSQSYSGGEDETYQESQGNNEAEIVYSEDPTGSGYDMAQLKEAAAIESSQGLQDGPPAFNTATSNKRNSITEDASPASGQSSSSVTYGKKLSNNFAENVNYPSFKRVPKYLKRVTRVSNNLQPQEREEKESDVKALQFNKEISLPMKSAGNGSYGTGVISDSSPSQMPEEDGVKNKSLKHQEGEFFSDYNPFFAGIKNSEAITEEKSADRRIQVTYAVNPRSPQKLGKKVRFPNV